jgi:hypothetical protein
MAEPAGALAALWRLGYDRTMTRQRLAAILCIALLGLSLGGCSKCGPFWGEGGRACHADAPR